MFGNKSRLNWRIGKLGVAGAGMLLGLAPAFISPSLAQNSPGADSTKVDPAGFKNPAPEFRGNVWYTYNIGGLNEGVITAQMDRTISTMKDAYGGFMVTPSGGGGGGGGPRRGAATGPAGLAGDPAGRGAPAAANNSASYLNDEFFKLYRFAIAEGLKRNLPMHVMYDELQFPTGFAGGLFRQKYPNLIGRSLDIVDKDVAGPTTVDLSAPINNGTYIGAVMMNMDTLERVDVSQNRSGERVAVSCPVPQGNWKVMLFYLDPSANTRGLVDYLDPTAVDGLIDVMYQKYYDHLKEYFGNPIKYTFYDEPGMQHPEFKGRLWTARFNDDFQKKYGENPMKLYPALFYDIGPETAAARNALFGFRADMYADNFIGRIAAWDEAHGVKMAGHLDVEESPNQVSVQGDLMKVFKHQHVPGHDDIWWSGRSTMSYKIVTSSAFNWDKPLCVAETYAAYRQSGEKVALRTAMDQHAFGINFQVGNYPQGTPPEFGAYIGRMQYLLQHGRHVADVAVVYPIASMQTDFRFAAPARVGPRNANPNFYYALSGGVVPVELDYQQLGEMLFRGYHIDYTYLHPEIIESKCIVDGNKLILDNKENREEFKVVFLPGGDTINLGVAKKLQEFYNAGGAIIATSKLPTKAAEFGKDKEVQQIIDAIFGLPEREPITADLRSNTNEFKNWWSHPNQKGGQAFFLPKLDTTMMTDALEQCDPVRDVDFMQVPAAPPPAVAAAPADAAAPATAPGGLARAGGAPGARGAGRGARGAGGIGGGGGGPQKLPPTWPVKTGEGIYDGAFTYIHKFKDGHDIYFFANSFDTPLDTNVVLRGVKKLAKWDPHTGEQQPAETKASDSTTTVHLTLDPVKSVFYVSE